MMWWEYLHGESKGASSWPASTQTAEDRRARKEGAEPPRTAAPPAKQSRAAGRASALQAEDEDGTAKPSAAVGREDEEARTRGGQDEDARRTEEDSGAGQASRCPSRCLVGLGPSQPG